MEGDIHKKDYQNGTIINQITDENKKSSHFIAEKQAKTIKIYETLLSSVKSKLL